MISQVPTSQVRRGPWLCVITPKRAKNLKLVFWANRTLKSKVLAKKLSLYFPLVFYIMIQNETAPTIVLSWTQDHAIPYIRINRLPDSSEAQRHPFRKTAISNLMPRYWFLFRWFYPSLYFKLWQSTTNFEAEHKKWINKENQVVHLWQKWQMFAVCWVSPLMDSSAAALFVASTKTQKLHDASSCICRICASSIILDFKKHQLVFHPQYPQVWF